MSQNFIVRLQRKPCPIFNNQLHDDMIKLYLHVFKMILITNLPFDDSQTQTVKY